MRRDAGLPGLTFFFTAIALALLGPGAYSFDSYRFGRRVVEVPVPRQLISRAANSTMGSGIYYTRTCREPRRDSAGTRVAAFRHPESHAATL